MRALHLLLLQLLGCCPRGWGASSPRLQPPPLLVTCWGPHGQVCQRQDNESWVSCLWNSTVTLRYQPAPGARPEAERKEGQPPPPPRCFWYLNSAWLKKTTRWSGQVMLQTGLLPGSTPPPVASSLLTVQCSSASCAAPKCFHQNVSVEMSGQDMRLFVLWPQTQLIQAWQPVHLGWCARFKSASWQYRFSSQGGSPSTLLLPSSKHQEMPPPAVYPTVELQQTCATYYSYRLTVRYRHHGLHVASVSIEQMPQISLSLSLKVEPDMLHVLSVSSKLLSVPQQPLGLSWRLQPLTPRTLAYRLVDTQGIGGWLHSYSSFTLQSNFCAVPTPQSPSEVVVASIYFHVDEKRFEELTGELHLLNGTLSLTAGRETHTHVNLRPGKTDRSTYIFMSNNGTFYTNKENNSPISTDGPNTRAVFYQHKELSYLLSIEFVDSQWYKFNMYLYMNQKRALFRSLAERHLEVHVFSSGRPLLQSFTYLVWFIPEQHPMLQCEWTFHLQLFATEKDHLLQNSTYTYSDHVRNATRFVRRSALPFDPEKYTGFVAKVNCNRSALRSALLGVRVNNYAAKTIEVPVSCQKEPCYIYKVHIQRPVLHSSVLRQKRGTTFFLFVRLLLDCNVGVFTKPLWRIYRVQDTTTLPDWEKPINSSSMYGTDMILLTVPSFTLDYGLYLFNFTVEVIPIDTKKVLRGSDKIYILIERTDLVANIAGGSFRTVGFSDRWILDGSASYDPDSQEGRKGITFTWYCTKDKSDYKNMTGSPGKKCHPGQRDLKWLTSSGPVQVMPPESLPGNTVYYFRLVIQKDTRRSYADQTIDVQPGYPPLLDVTCLENCGSTLIPTERFTLSGKCLNCRSNSQTVYYWSLFLGNSTEISFDWSSRTSTGRSGAYLSINALTFTKTAHRFYILLLKVTTWDGRSSIYRHTFKVNSPPRTGKCTINPHWGTAFLTKFVVQCSGFYDSNLPLTYKVIVASNVPKTTKITSVEENTFGPIVYFGYQPETPPSFLPVGVPSQKYTLKLYVQVHNSLGAFTQVTLNVRVQNPANSRPLALVFHQLLMSVTGLSAPMTSYLQTGDYFSAGYLTYLAASVLNYIKAASTLQLPKAQFRQRLIKTALNISVDNTMEINQVVACLSQVTEKADEVDIRSQDLAIKKLTEVTAMLKIQRNESHWSEEAEIQTSGILRCLFNILRAALLHRRNVNVSGVKQVFSIMEHLTEIVFKGKVPGEIETLMETKLWNITLRKDETWNITNAFSTRNTCRNCFYPSLEKGNYSGLDQDAVISTALFEFDENPFPWLGYTSEITTVLGFKMAETKTNGDLLGIMPAEAEITIPRKDKEFSTFQLAIGPDKTQAYTTGGFSFEVNRNTKSIYIQILTKLKVTFKVLVFTGANVTHAHPIASFAAFHNMPTVASKNETASADCNIKGPYIICLPESLLTATAEGSRTGTQNISVVLMTSYIVRYQTHRLVSMLIFSDQCLFLDGVRSLWREDTCRLGSLTDWQKVHCVCNMKRGRRSLSARTTSNASTFDIRFLAAKVIVTPNTVDLGQALIADIPKNPVTLLTVLFIFGVYFLLSLWAMRKDRADRGSKNKIIVLPDNDPFDKVSYLVTLYTGSRWGSGTKADVFLQLIGQNGTSDVHCLCHPDFLSFQQGSTDCFLLTTKKDLGDICSLRVWHNNKGSSPSWFLSRAKVENMCTRRTWFFICRKWLSLDKGDHLLERTFSVTNPKTPLPRIDYFLMNLSNSLAEGHLWFSIFAHFLTGTFSRLQRLSSCLAILLLNLLVNIMFFNADKNEESPIHLRYLRSVTVGIECALLTIPVEMIIIALFKYSQKETSPRGVAQTDLKVNSPLLSGNFKNWKERLQKFYLSKTSAQSSNIIPLENLPCPSNLQSLPRSRKTRSRAPSQNWSNCTVSERDANVIVTEEHTITANSPPMAKVCQRRPMSNSNFSNDYADEGGNFQKERKPLSITSMPFRKRPRVVFCWWCVYLSWALVIAVTGLSSFFIVVYGLSYGYQTSLEWLLASATSFIENVFFLSILKITFFSAMSTICPKYCENITWSTQEKYSEIKLAKETMSADKMREMHLKLAEVRSTKQYQPLEADEIANMLKWAKIKAKAFIFIKGSISHLVFLTLLLNFAYSTENTSSFHYNRFIRNQFSPRLSSVNKLEHIYVWVNDLFLPLMHNDIQPTFLPESWSKIIGLPRMRQVRAKATEKKCFHPHSFVNNFVISKSHCLHKYGSDIPEKGDYAGTWTKVANQSISKDAKDASSYSGFIYQRNRTPWMYYSYGDLHTYGPAGYTFYFFPEEGKSNSTTRLDALQQSNWLDEKTWAVIIELTTFNSDANLFCTISVIFEMSHLGIIKPSLSVHSFALPIFQQQTKAQMFLFVIVLAFLLIYIADELHAIGQERKDYIKNIFNIINFAVKSAFLLFVFLKVMKFKMGADIVKFYLLHPNDFIYFHAVSHLDQILRITVGFLLFLVVLKTLKYFQFIYGVRLAQRSILAALPGLSSMSLVVVVYFFVFMSFGYLVFGQHEWHYNSMIHSAQTVFSYCVSAFRDTAFSSNRFLGGLFLASFVMVMICVLINLVQAVIMSAYADMKNPIYEEPSSEEQVVTFVLQRLRKLFYLLICKTPKTSEPDVFHSGLSGQPERRRQRHLGLKNRKINGKKMVYLVI